MAAKVFSWQDIPSDSGKKKGGKASTFLKLEPGNTYTVRLVLDPIGYLQHWEPVVCRSPFKDEKTGEIIDPLMALGHEPKQRFACWVLHREDNSALKLMDFGIGLAKDFQKWSKANGGESSGGMKGPDFRIIVEKGETRKQTKYTAVHMNVAPFTQDEIAVLKAAGGTEGLMSKLKELRRDNTPEEIRALMAEKGISGPPASKATAPAAAAKTSAPATVVKDDDMTF
jgi:hypothetical protein